jgi:hypothetical protein
MISPTIQAKVAATERATTQTRMVGRRERGEEDGEKF